MSLPQSAVERPVFTVMLVLIVVILGSVALSRLSVDLMPDITFPTLSIVTNYGNASPEEVETLITRPIEEAVAAVPGVDTIDSESGEGFSNVRISFTWGSDLNEAANDLRDRLDRVISSLPEDAGRPSLRKFDLSATPIMELGVTSMLSPLELRNLIDEQVEYRLERVPGIAAINVRGGMTREIHINLDPEKISSLKIPLDQVANAINSANVNIPAGSISIGNSELNIRTPGEFTAISELLQTVVLERSGSPITLEQIASIEDSWQKISRHTRINAQTG
ncbi:MAG: efflux RND transporter permease subunit, partial [Candidatus Cloacimonetes bacterium]|nr:efflux RND transporter permease subunit [Candidatus Cloacimonadota bacterium]